MNAISPLPSLIPENAPFSSEQRAWLNGFFAGLLSLDAKAGAMALDGAMPGAAAKALATPRWSPATGCDRPPRRGAC